MWDCHYSLKQPLCHNLIGWLIGWLIGCNIEGDQVKYLTDLGSWCQNQGGEKMGPLWKEGIFYN